MHSTVIAARQGAVAALPGTAAFGAQPQAPRVAAPRPHRQQGGRRRALRVRADSTKQGLQAIAQAAAAAPESLQWAKATVVENREASADGSVRTLLLSVEDHVTFLDGRKVRHVQESRRWIDDYK